MALNQKFDSADSFSVPVPADTAAGVPLLIGAGNVPGTTRTKEGEGGNVDGFATVDFAGAYEFTVTGTLTVMQPVYITAGGAMTATSTSNTLWGFALTAKGSGSGLATVRPAKV